MLISQAALISSKKNTTPRLHGCDCAGLLDDDVQFEMGCFCLLRCVADCCAHLYNPPGARDTRSPDREGAMHPLSVDCACAVVPSTNPEPFVFVILQSANFVRAHWLWRHVTYPGGGIPDEDKSPHSPANGLNSPCRAPKLPNSDPNSPFSTADNDSRYISKGSIVGRKAFEE
jgi:hypothetical protein